MNIKMILTAMMMAFVMMSGSAYADEKININTASVAQLQGVKGIGEKTAKAIVAYREKHGHFKSVDGLANVKGIGGKKLSKIKDGLEVSKSKSDKKKDRMERHEKKDDKMKHHEKKKDKEKHDKHDD